MNKYFIIFLIFIFFIRQIMILNANNETYINTTNIKTFMHVQLVGEIHLQALHAFRRF